MSTATPRHHHPVSARPAPAMEITPASAPELLRAQARPALSMLVPVHHGPESRADHIVIKNLLREVELLDPAAAPELTERVRALLAPAGFWRHTGRGLAVFDNGQALRYAWLDAPPAPISAVGHRFLVAPVYDQLRNKQPYAALELGQRSCALIEGDRAGAREPIMRWEKELAPPLGSHEHTLGQRFAGSGQQFYGSSQEPKAEARALEFFRTIDQAVRERLGSDGPPLFLVGVEWLLPLYRSASRYQHLMPEAWAHGADHVGGDALHAWCAERMAGRAESARARTIDQHQILAGGPRLLTHVEQALPSASSGMAASAVIASDRQRWGTFDPVSGAVEVHDERRPGDEELLNALYCICASGGSEAWLLPHAQVPSGLDCSVMLRFG